jgi:hypothetical protein
VPELGVRHSTCVNQYHGIASHCASSRVPELGVRHSTCVNQYHGIASHDNPALGDRDSGLNFVLAHIVLTHGWRGSGLGVKIYGSISVSVL